MSYKISKELFEAVMEEDFNCTKDDYIYYGIRDTKDSARISINQFFFKCKEWAYSKGYGLVTFPLRGNYSCIITDMDKSLNEIFDSKLFALDKLIQADAEQQAVFDACQWVLDNKEK